MGGLGNQLFQIFTGISHGLDNKTAFRIKFSKSDMISPVDGISKRPTYWDNFLKTVSRFTYRDRPLNTPVLREKAAFQYNKLPCVESDFILWGYYQSYQYFDHNLDTIKRLLNIDINRHNTKTQFHHYFPNASNNNNNTKKPISMHFRIGDYAKASHVHPILTVKYYMEALNLLNSKLENLSTRYYILYFFEDQDRDKVADIIKELSDRFPEIEFRRCDTEIEDWQQMLLMSLSSHNILANSTFSWWGAYLNTNLEKIVVYPSKWINTHQDLNDLFPSDWSKINIYKTNILVIDKFHHKNMTGLDLLLKSINYSYKFGNINEIDKYDIIYSPNQPIDASKYPDKKFIFGPHFSVFPDSRLININNIHKNSIYIQPSKWAANTWRNMNVENIIKIKEFPFPVEIDKFRPSKNNKKTEVFIYFKRRKSQELSFVESFLNKKNISYKIFNYIEKYSEEDYLRYLQSAKYGIIVDAHESQGFAIEEALSCDVPLLVWKVKYMSQEEGGNYPDIPCTNIAYWDKRCGEFFEEKENFEEIYYKFINKLETYKPRKYILEYLTPKKCGENFVKLINSF